MSSTRIVSAPRLDTTAGYHYLCPEPLGFPFLHQVPSLKTYVSLFRTRVTVFNTPSQTEDTNF